MKVKDIIAELSERYNQEDELLCVLWSIEDPLSIEDRLTKKEAIEVLDRCKRYHDATIGVNWEVMDYHVSEVLAEREVVQ